MSRSDILEKKNGLNIQKAQCSGTVLQPKENIVPNSKMWQSQIKDGPLKNLESSTLSEVMQCQGKGPKFPQK